MHTSISHKDRGHYERTPHDDPVSIPDNCKVAVSGDIVGQQAAIVYHKLWSPSTIPDRHFYQRNSYGCKMDLSK
uniref:Uncharacterized protein n=1 Tax=Knipowitschia caucasica TaxID=637954 RepID=A0AAV2J0D5_KNICA